MVSTPTGLRENCVSDTCLALHESRIAKIHTQNKVSKPQTVEPLLTSLLGTKPSPESDMAGLTNFSEN